LFDLSDLETPIPASYSKPFYYWLCTNCRCVSLTKQLCAACQKRDFIPFLDRRPLLLSKEIMNGVVGLIDEAADSLPAMNIDEAIICSGEYMPFLSQLLKNSELAASRAASSHTGFRITSMSTEEVLSLFRKRQLPPSPSQV